MTARRDTIATDEAGEITDAVLSSSWLADHDARMRAEGREQVREAHAYGVEVFVNADGTGEHWRMDDEDVTGTYEQAVDLRDVLIEDQGYDRAHLRIVALSVVRAAFDATGGQAADHPEGTKVTEWGIRWSPEHDVWWLDPDGKPWRETDALRAHRQPTTAHAYTRQRTSYADVVTDWVEVSDD